MQTRVDDIQIPVTAANSMSHLAYTRLADVDCGAGKAVNAAHFLHRARRNSKNLAAAAEENDLFSTQRLRNWGGPKPHHCTPTGVTRDNPRTRFSMAG